MKILCFIDSLGSGGAQRQLCTLAVLFKKMGDDVSVLTYHRDDFYLPMLQEAGIQRQCVESTSPIGRIFDIRRFLRNGDQDVVLAFLDAPNLYAELAALPRKKWGLVVSERSANPNRTRFVDYLMRKTHRFADYVTANSHTNRLMIEKAAPNLKPKLVTVYNAIDLERFSPAFADCASSDGNFRFITAASFQHAKNPINLIEALALLKTDRPKQKIAFDWHGRLPDPISEPDKTVLLEKARSLVSRLGLADVFQFLDPTPRIEERYRQADAIVLPSLYEGLPNVVCEAMSCGRPIIMSDVCDAGNLVIPGKNGFLFDPLSPRSIADALIRFVDCSVEKRLNMGAASRELAIKTFDPQIVANHYQVILRSATTRIPKPIDHWTPQPPASACHSANESV